MLWTLSLSKKPAVLPLIWGQLLGLVCSQLHCIAEVFLSLWNGITYLPLQSCSEAWSGLNSWQRKSCLLFSLLFFLEIINATCQVSQQIFLVLAFLQRKFPEFNFFPKEIYSSDFLVLAFFKKDSLRACDRQPGRYSSCLFGWWSYSICPKPLALYFKPCAQNLSLVSFLHIKP